MEEKGEDAVGSTTQRAHLTHRKKAVALHSSLERTTFKTLCCCPLTRVDDERAGGSPHGRLSARHAPTPQSEKGLVLAVAIANSPCTATPKKKY